MTPSTDHHPSPASRSTQPPGFPGAVHDELAKLRGRIVGDCAACGHTVYVAHNFTRFDGEVVHLRCPITTSSSRRLSPKPPLGNTGGAADARYR